MTVGGSVDYVRPGGAVVQMPPVVVRPYYFNYRVDHDPIPAGSHYPFPPNIAGAQVAIAVTNNLTDVDLTGASSRWNEETQEDEYGPTEWTDKNDLISCDPPWGGAISPILS